MSTAVQYFVQALAHLLKLLIDDDVPSLRRAARRMESVRSPSVLEKLKEARERTQP